MAQPRLPSPVTRFEDHEVEPERQSRDGAAVRQGASIQQSVRRLPDAGSLPVIDRLLGQAEAA